MKFILKSVKKDTVLDPPKQGVTVGRIVAYDLDGNELFENDHNTFMIPGDELVITLRLYPLFEAGDR